MAYGPGLYLAVWMDGRNSTNQDIFGRRLDSQGKLQGLELQMAATTTTKLNPAVVGSGAGYLVAWTDGGKSIKGALAGKTTGPTATPTLRSTTGLLTHPALAFDGCKYSLAWSEKVSLIALGYDVMALPVTTAGVPATGQLSKITHSGDQAEAVMASRGSERSLVLFSDSRTSGNDTDIYAGTYKP